jgi:hypothetical protein
MLSESVRRGNASSFKTVHSNCTKNMNVKPLSASKLIPKSIKTFVSVERSFWCLGTGQNPRYKYKFLSNFVLWDMIKAENPIPLYNEARYREGLQYCNVAFILTSYLPLCSDESALLGVHSYILQSSGWAP